ncbi:MAG: VacJ family lipoprotein [Gammaproteobacteria bacterium]|nr:VacJ family lipoprotein [Gammaproteobacteria bacterium]
MESTKTKLYRIRSYIPTILALFLVLALTGCASGQSPEDPYEGYNRKVFAFNRQIDRFIYRPVAKTYDYVMPSFARKGVRNFFANINQLPIIGNDLLQANGEWLVSDIGRLLINTTLGIGGLFDVATKIGIEKHEQDFGLTLAKWGYRKSSYFIIPFLPSSTPRDIIGFSGDFFMTPWPYIDSDWWGWAAYGVRFVDNRASLLGPDKLIDDAFDPYLLVRDAYLQRRQSQIERVLDPHGNHDGFGDDFEEGSSSATAEDSKDSSAASSLSLEDSVSTATEVKS